MAHYQITITKTEPNPEYKEQMLEFAKNNRMYDRGYNTDKGEPLKDFVKDALICELTEEQFKKVKAEVFKAFE